MESYESIRPLLKTGDLVLFSGKGGISEGIKWFTGSRWSHIGVVMRLPDQFDAVLLWESTTLGTAADVFSGRIEKGVMLVPLSARLRNYRGEVAVRMLSVQDRSPVIRAASVVREKYKRTPYERNYWELFRSAYDGLFGQNRRDTSSLFCSEAVAELYQAAALLPGDPPSNEYTPEDFARLQLDGRCTFDPTAELGPVVMLDG